jgi:hypothetical protein
MGNGKKSETKHQECALVLNSGDVKKWTVSYIISLAKLCKLKKIQNLHQQFK